MQAPKENARYITKPIQLWAAWLIGLTSVVALFLGVAKWIVAVNENMPKSLISQLLIAVSEFEFDGFVLWTPVRDVGETEDVYIGSYGQSDYVEFAPGFADVVKDEFSFSEYVLKNQHRKRH